jgi:Helix-turn-helix domain
MSKHRRRRSSDARHVRLYHHVLNSQAWLALSAPARVVYIEIFRLYNGANNGQLALSVRTAAERCRIAKDTAARAFKELEELRFIECMQKGAFSYKVRHATEWRITELRCDVTGRLPDKNFMRWGRDKRKPVPNDALTVPKQAQKAA